MNTTLQDRQELKRRRRERVIIVITILLVLGLTFLESRLVGSDTPLPFSGEVLIFGLINVNLILIILLVFLIVRNLVKLIFERRRGVLGSKLRSKLVAAFVSLSLIPTIVLFLVSIQFLSYSIDNWFNLKIGSALDSSLSIGQTYYQTHGEETLNLAKRIGYEITAGRLYERDMADQLEQFLKERQSALGRGLLEVTFDNREERYILRDPAHPDVNPPKLTEQMVDDLYRGHELSLVQSLGIGDLVSGIVPLYINFELTDVIGVAAVSYIVPGDLAGKLSEISKTSEEYRQFNLLKNPIKWSFIITLSIVTLLIIFSATWFGLFLAKGITVPIQDLAEATDEISRGNLDYHIDVLADDEIGVLVDSFNRMTEDLKNSSDELKKANIVLDERRHYMETVLKNVSAGVISLDREGVITTVNRAAEIMLDITADGALNTTFDRALAAEHADMISRIRKEMDERDSDFLEKQAQIVVRNTVLTLLISITTLRDDQNHSMGMVVVFEDISQLQKAERISAWREVARRIAHEIKNPLTPVKLSAERLQKKYGNKMEGEEKAVFSECTQAIVNQVDTLKNLVDEFSKFARLPISNPAPHDINQTIAEPVLLFQDAHKTIDFEYTREEGLPLVMIDEEQIRRVMVNLLDNAVTALASNSEKGRIEISTSINPENRNVRVEVRDNGAGIEPKDRVKLFEPYFSTKKSGMGLGLTIVSSIISDHRGVVGIQDNSPRGTVIFFEIPRAEDWNHEQNGTDRR
ncbi:MAG: ATP-binding protein [Syntrophales bacterium]|jgi:two-component system nitrogen regulation sensor histidine kinase NtrY|nr:ATP-binding protein [Syntrophales bacterium]MCK9527766.1 ATP-binding protein [Syntrophales bacterium]MDX9921579.1 ATP-binding protein [Syntrophales bacterium]